MQSHMNKKSLQNNKKHYRRVKTHSLVIVKHPLLPPERTAMKSWIHICQDNFHACWILLSFGFVIFYIIKITLHIFPMTFHTIACLRRVSFSIDTHVTVAARDTIVRI